MKDRKTAKNRGRDERPASASRPPFRVDYEGAARAALSAGEPPLQQPEDHEHMAATSPYSDVVAALADALHDHEEAMRQIARERGLAKAWLEKLRVSLTQCEEALATATRALESVTVEINGKHYLAANHIAEMKCRERQLYNQVNSRHPIYTFLLQWTVGDYDERVRQSLERDIAAVEQEYVAQTEEKKRALSTLESQRRDLLQEIADHDAAALVIKREKEQVALPLETQLKDLPSVRKADQESLATALAGIDGRMKAVVEKTNSRLEAQRRDGEQRRSAALDAIRCAVDSLFTFQPPLTELQPTDLPRPDRYPSELCLGWFVVHGRPDWRCWFPSTIPFPIQQPIWISTDVDDARQQVQALLLRLMTALPPSGLTINVIDPQRLGESIGPLRRLLNRPGPFLGREVTTLADEIETALREENDRLEELIQVTLGNGANTWRAYNANNPRTPLQYRVVVYYDAPEQLTDKSLVFLQRLAELGPERGILPIIVLGELATTDRRGLQLQKTIVGNAFGLQDFWVSDEADVQEIFEGVADCRGFPDALPLHQACDKVLDEISAAYGEAMNRSPGIEELWADADLWRYSATDGLSIPLGWSRDGRPVSLELGRPGGTGIHTLVAGRPGAGKSSLLHVLLHSLCHRYSPSEVRVMLLDYKQGVEMAMYASPVLPHADLVAMDSDVSYGVTVLEYLRDEIERRAKLFQEARKTSLDQYNRNCDIQNRLPRILLLVDEFQALFAEDRVTTTDVESLLIALLRQGRAYGIHVLLCTQTLSGLTNISLTQLTALIAERVCLACDAQDSAKTLSSGNEAGAQLAGPPEAILNSSNGSKDANRLFIFPEPLVTACQQHLHTLSQKAVDAGFATSARLFRGDETITLPPPSYFKDTVGACVDVQAVVGQTLSFESGPLVMRWPARLGGHVLLAGPSPAVRDGVLTALLRSLACREQCLEVVVYDVRENPRWQNPATDISDNARLSRLPADWTADFATLPVLASGNLGILIIDGLDQDRLLKSAAIRPRAVTPPATPTTSVTDFLETGHKKGWRVIATADNWRRLDTPERKELLNEFQIRIGFHMSDDDAARMTFNAARSFGISGNQARAIYFDQHANRLARFRPFVLRP